MIASLSPRVPLRVACILLISADVLVAQRPPAARDSAAVVNALAAFHSALAAADSSTAISLLDSRVLVLESGELETREAYRAHHLPADIAFARAIASTRRVERVVVRGDMAWVAATSRTKGTFEGRAIDSEGTELTVLTRIAGRWRISAIHWSSHRVRPPGS